MTTVPKDETIAALTDVWASIDALLAGLDDADWSRPTNLPGWDVKAVVAHVVGTESMLLGDPAPDVTSTTPSHPHVRNDIGRFNEAWVVAMARRRRQPTCWSASAAASPPAPRRWPR